MFTPQQRAVLLLWKRVNASLSAFYKLEKYFGTAKQALQASESQWQQLGIHKKHIERQSQATQLEDENFLAVLKSRINQGEFKIVFQFEVHYPQQLLNIFDPPPVLFYRGNIERLNQPQIAIVGSRKPTHKAQKFTFDMAQYLAKSGFIITSGLAQGVDAQAHLGALAQDKEACGRSIGVMGTGIDVCYPKQHQSLFDRMVNEGGCIISELFPGTLPHKHTFPRRNRLVAGLSLGTIVTEAAVKSGSLITARLTSEQGKQVFALPSSIDNPNAEGCHYLIREGATLIYHPDQVINDLCHQLHTPLQKQNDTTAQESMLQETELSSKVSNVIANNSLEAPNINTISNALIFNAKPISKEPKSVTISEHLQPLWVHIEFDAQDLDALIAKTNLDTASLLSQLMELELMGVITQVGGRYQRL
ncbi:DNA-processing protein DprA [Psychrobacter sp.]|uniref:DNA-processing protein DprA n=1 Tax=Psychrobacter sp. TaxID=56811 RepID=UPI0025E356AE|nr:DNA-processing protein DprA [Psychrobacter sp.]